MTQTFHSLFRFFTFFLLLTSVFFFRSLAQERYLTPIFDEVKVDSQVIYGNNISIISGGIEFEDLLMDVYQPVGDTQNERPLVIVIPTGNFMPRIRNKSPNGSFRDSTNVELCQQLAKRGFVAASISHRLGWATAGNLDALRSTFAPALYRAIQDANTSIRYFKKQAAEDGNPFGIDVTKIALGGIGSGGYAALGAAYLDKPQEILIEKLLKGDGSPYINQLFLGDIEARDSAIICRPNYPNYRSDFNVVFSLGGAIMDLSWIEEGDIPMVNFHTPDDPVVPYQTGFVRVPISDEILFEMHGSYAITEHAVALGNQAVFFSAGFTDDFTLMANTKNDGLEGLYPFQRPRPTTGEVFECEMPIGLSFSRKAEHNPWNWWNEEQFIADWDSLSGERTTGAEANCLERAANPDMSSEKARTYIDTVLNYLTPRILKTFGLFVSNEEVLSQTPLLRVYPNPARTSMMIALTSSQESIEEVSLYDMNGRLLFTHKHILSSSFQLIRAANIPAGLYLLKIKAGDNYALRKVIFE